MANIDLWKMALGVLKKEIESGNKAFHISKQLGVSPSTVSRWLNDERGKDRPNAKLMQAIFNKYKFSLNEVLMQLLPPDQAETLSILLEEESEAFQRLAKLLMRKDKVSEKVKQDLLFYLRQYSDEE